MELWCFWVSHWKLARIQGFSTRDAYLQCGGAGGADQKVFVDVKVFWIDLGEGVVYEVTNDTPAYAAEAYIIYIIVNISKSLDKTWMHIDRRTCKQGVCTNAFAIHIIWKVPCWGFWLETRREENFQCTAGGRECRYDFFWYIYIYIYTYSHWNDYATNLLLPFSSKTWL